jgi:hypothetical protein
MVLAARKLEGKYIGYGSGGLWHCGVSILSQRTVGGAAEDAGEGQILPVEIVSSVSHFESLGGKG